MEERLARLTAEQRSALTDKDLDNHQRGASQKATIELRGRLAADHARARLKAEPADSKKRAELEAIEQRLRMERQFNLEQLRALLLRLPGDCKESPPSHFRRSKPRGLTHGFLQYCTACDRIACRVHDGNRNRGGFQCQHDRKSYFFVLLETADRTYLFFPSKPVKLVVRRCSGGDPLSGPCLVAWVQKERVKELPWFDPSGLTEAELRQRLADLLVR